MISKIVVAFKKGEADPLGRGVERNARFLGVKTGTVSTRRVYTMEAELSDPDLAKLRSELFVDPVTEESVDEYAGGFDWLVEVSFKLGVTDAVGISSAEAISGVLKGHDDCKVFTSTQYLFSGITRDEVNRIATGMLANQLIQDINIFHKSEPKTVRQRASHPAKGKTPVLVKAYDHNVSDDLLMKISREGILSLSLEEMKAIRNYFQRSDVREERKKIGLEERFWGAPTDAELEMIAQTWSEHCKHKIFGAEIEYQDENGKKQKIDGLFKTFIRDPSIAIGSKYGWVMSAFHDNAGIVRFNERINLSDKIETHNAPSALEPFGGAITGILGVNRDIIGAGIGSTPMFNIFGYCFGSPFYEKQLPEGVMHPRRIRDGVHKGVAAGGNESGIPLVDGFEYFDDRYTARPLVYCGTIGSMPAIISGRPSEKKNAEPGDNVVMIGGRIGKDGIHGATFSSAELDLASPVQAVQIGDSITQKKMSDFVLEARDVGLYNSITDNGAGGLSSSVGEMARNTDGCKIDLEKAPLKYPGLAPWEILISESQERMTLSVSPGKTNEFMELAKRRGVEATILGQFGDSKKFHAMYGDMTVVYLDMDFLHEGFPRLKLKAKWEQKRNEEPEFEQPKDLSRVLEEMLARLNICSKEVKIRQYDHEVKCLSVIKPLVGVGRDTPSDAAVSFVEYGSSEGLIVSHGICPSYSAIDTYHMAASAIDEAVRRIIASGGKMPSKETVFYALDNFCWNISSLDAEDSPYKIAQLVRANMALKDYCEAYGLPCISGKDSMKNVWLTKEGAIAIPPTLLFSARGKISDAAKAVTMDFKSPGDIVYMVGTTSDELGGSEYFSYMGEKQKGKAHIGNNVPKVDAKVAKTTYENLSRAVQAGAVSSIHTPTIGGIGIALVQSAFSGGYGAQVDLSKVPVSGDVRDDHILFSQSNSRFVVTVPEKKQKEFESAMKGARAAKVGVVTDGKKLVITSVDGREIVNIDIEHARSAWVKPLQELQ